MLANYFWQTKREKWAIYLQLSHIRKEDCGTTRDQRIHGHFPWSIFQLLYYYLLVFFKVLYDPVANGSVGK
jgi:hypothetical protein